MCYTAETPEDNNKLKERYAKKLQQGIDPDAFDRMFGTVSGFSHPKMIVIPAKKPLQFSLFTWGLEPSHGYNTLNARSETYKTGKLYKPFSEQRCIIPVQGFYEWQHLNKLGQADPAGKKKKKFFIQDSQSELTALAGIYSELVNQETGEIEGSFAVLTLEANPLMAEIHNTKKRMPLILREENEMNWLETGETGELAELHAIDESADTAGYGQLF